MRPIVLAALVAMLACNGAWAQSARKDGGGSAQLMQQMQQLAAERTQLQAENARMKRELAETRKERDKLKSDGEALDKRLHNTESAAAHASGDRKQLEDELTQTKDRMTELVGKFRETVAALREVETDRDSRQRQLETRTADYKSCVDRNAQLYTMNDEILGRMDGQGFWSGVGRVEPFTRIKRTQLENLADDYRARAAEARLPAAAAPSAVPAPVKPGSGS
jgi:septal ring factor EnvC (AmiA/AmiB activator)